MTPATAERRQPWRQPQRGDLLAGAGRSFYPFTAIRWSVICGGAAHGPAGHWNLARWSRTGWLMQPERAQ